MSVSFSPIGPWPLVALAALAVMVLTIWAYRQRLRGTSGRWRWLALGLRLAAVLLCLLAALRPSIVYKEKKKQAASIVVLADRSMSMSITDEAGGVSRWSVERKRLDDIRAIARTFGQNLDVKFYDFDTTLQEDRPDNPGEPIGRGTALGAAMLEAVKRQQKTRVATMVVLADGHNNDGIAPEDAARQLRSQQIPVLTVGFGSENAGTASRDISFRGLVAGPTVFVKNQLHVEGSLVARGFSNQTVDVEMLVEGQSEPVARTQVKVIEGQEVFKVTGLKYIPSTAGEKKITLRAKPKEGELIKTNNEMSTFITVLQGGLNVLYLQGPNFTWEFKFLMRAIATSPDIQVDLEVLRAAASGDHGDMADAALVPGRYDVYILGDIPASHLTPTQQKLLTDVVEKGAGLIMLGGRSSFGAGGWASSPLARVLPVNLHPGDGQLEPEGGVKFVPNPNALDSYVLQLGTSREDTARIWNSLPPLSGTNRFSAPKPTAVILGQTAGPAPEPIMLSIDNGKSRVLAFGGETWVWARALEDMGRLAHRKLWRQIIFWLAHKEDSGGDRIKLKLDQRRIAVGQKVEMLVTARDAKGAPITDLKYEMKVARDEPNGVPEPVDHYSQGDEERGAYPALGQPGDYRATVTATRNGQVVGTDSARFLVYQDDREMVDPAADLALLRQISEITGGASVTPEKLAEHLKALDGKMFTEYETQTERRVWDNWPFLLVFATLLTLEWWLRKRNGWV